MTSAQIVARALEKGVALPAFNIPYLPMMEPVIRAVADEASFALIETARLEWFKFEAKGPAEVKAEFDRCSRGARGARSDCVRLHLDHVPVIDEDGARVDWKADIARSLALGYGSVMIDGSRLPLQENIEATREAAALAHAAGVACEAELGAVLGHEAGPLPPYEELFATGRGFTRVEEAERFVRESGCDWLSVAIGNVHGAVSAATRDRKKVEARLALDHLSALAEATRVPLVLHGGSGIRREDMRAAMKRGIAKVNVGTEIRQAYEQALASRGRDAAARATYERTVWLLRDYFGISGIGRVILA